MLANKTEISIQGMAFYPKNLFKKQLLAMLILLENKKDFTFENCSLELLLVRDNEIALYNKDYLNCLGPTNILSFPEQEGALLPNQDNRFTDHLGTLILSIDTLERERILYGQNPHEHLTRLLAHGLVHLLGYDHGEEMNELTFFLEKNTEKNQNLYEYTPLWSYYV